MLIDSVTLKVVAGSGGHGAATFLRTAGSARGGPDGGNGGNGGDVYIKGSANEHDLHHFRFKKSIRGEDGGPGTRHNGFGKNGKPTTYIVPLGTTITDLDSGNVIEIYQEGRPICIARGGRGGYGNVKFASATNQAPKNRELGTPGDVKNIRLDMRLIADIGLIGLPNAGKSSLLAALTRATPKIANYPFTTLEPNIGMMGTIAIADIPGLIEGASRGVGLGHTFLKHIEKTALLVHCIDATLSDYETAYQTVRNEFAAYNPQLLQKPEVIFVNKADLIDLTQNSATLNTFLKTHEDVFLGSVHNPEDIIRFKQTLEAKHDTLTSSKGEHMQGTIKTKTDRGFGFISRQGQDKDLFFHSKDLSGITFDALMVGDTVEFEVVDGPKGPSAKNVKKV